MSESNNAHIISLIKEVDLVGHRTKPCNELLQMILTFLDMFEIDRFKTTQDLLDFIKEHRNEMIHVHNMIITKQSTSSQSPLTKSPVLIVKDTKQQEKYERLLTHSLRFPSSIESDSFYSIPLDLNVMRENIALYKTIRFINNRIAEHFKDGKNPNSNVVSIPIDIGFSGVITWRKICSLYNRKIWCKSHIITKDNIKWLIIEWNLETQPSNETTNLVNIIPPNINFVKKETSFFMVLNYAELRIVEQIAQNPYASSVVIKVKNNLADIQIWKRVSSVFNDNNQFYSEITKVTTKNQEELFVLMIEW